MHLYLVLMIAYVVMGFIYLGTSTFFFGTFKFFHLLTVWNICGRKSPGGLRFVYVCLEMASALRFSSYDFLHSVYYYLGIFLVTPPSSEAFVFVLLHSGPESLKKSRPKKLMKSILYQFHTKIFFGQFPFFAISKMAKYQFLNWRKF